MENEGLFTPLMGFQDCFESMENETLILLQNTADDFKMK